MPSTNTTNLNLEKPAEGEQAGSWGDTINSNMDLIDSAVATKTGTETLTNKTLTSPVLNTGVSGTAIKDEDDMTSDSASHLATQQSIKAYVDAQTHLSLIDEDDMSSDSATRPPSQQSVKAYVDAQVDTEDTISELNDTNISSLAAGQLLLYHNTNSNWTNATLTAGSNVSITNADGSVTIASTDTNTQLTEEQVEDFVGGMVSGNTETGISVTYQDADGTLDFEVSDTTVAGDSGSTGITPGDTLTIAGGTNVTTAMSGDTLTITATDTNTQLSQEQVEDYVGGMLDGTETFIAVSYDDTDGNIDFVVPVLDEDDMATNSASHLATQQSIKAYTDAAAGSPAADNIAAGDSAINLTTTAGNITIDAQGDNTDIIFKGTDDGADTTFLTLDGSDVGRLITSGGITTGDYGSRFGDGTGSLNHYFARGWVRIGQTSGGAEQDQSGKGLIIYDDHSDGTTYTAIRVYNSSGGSPIWQNRLNNVIKSEIESNGDFLSATETFIATSDERLKENIVDSGSQWDDIKAVRVRKYSFKEDNLDAPNMLGVIAQELEAAGMGKLVQNHLETLPADDNSGETPVLDEDGNQKSFKTVKSSILKMKALKALQEAMARIETLEAKVAALGG